MVVSNLSKKSVVKRLKAKLAMLRFKRKHGDKSKKNKEYIDEIVDILNSL